MEVKVSFWADVDESDFDMVKHTFGKYGAEIISEEFPELKNIGYFNVEKADDSPEGQKE